MSVLVCSVKCIITCLSLQRRGSDNISRLVCSMNCIIKCLYYTDISDNMSILVYYRLVDWICCAASRVNRS